MTVPKFSALSARQKKITILRSGTFLGDRGRGPFRCYLYQIDSFYVEAWALRFGRQALWFKTFEGTAALGPYLRKIDISGLIGPLSIHNKA